VIDMDDDSRLQNVFWANTRSRASYEYFGDVITFDTTYLTNRYDMSFASDGNQQASLKDPLHVPVGPITITRSKMIKEAISGLIQEIWAGSKTEHSNLGPKENE
jgi:hypothetical protein